jgi:septum site-determining protein MinD
MHRVIAIHSFRRGTGKSSLTANIATLLAQVGRHVALVDMDLSSPSQPVIFGVPEADIKFTLNSFLWGDCEIEQAALPLAPYLKNVGALGSLYLVPADPHPNEIARISRGDYFINLLHDAFDRLSEVLNLDILLIDTHAGLSEETLLAFGISDAMSIILSNDPRDFQGTAVTVDILRELEIPRITLIVNQISPNVEVERARAQIAATYDCDVIGFLPHSPDLAALAGHELFALHYPNHPFSAELKQIALRLIA